MRPSQGINPFYFFKKKKQLIHSKIDLSGIKDKLAIEKEEGNSDEENSNEEENEEEEEKEEEEEEKDESNGYSNDSISSRKKKAQIAVTKLLSLQQWDVFSFARHNKFAELESLFIEGLNPDSKDQNGNTLLIIAAQNDNKRILKLCLRYGARINMQNSMGNTALHFATEYKYENIYNYLIQKGADTTIKNLRGKKATEGLR